MNKHCVRLFVNFEYDNCVQGMEVMCGNSMECVTEKVLKCASPGCGVRRSERGMSSRKKRRVIWKKNTGCVEGERCHKICRFNSSVGGEGFNISGPLFFTEACEGVYFSSVDFVFISLIAFRRVDCG